MPSFRICNLSVYNLSCIRMFECGGKRSLPPDISRNLSVDDRQIDTHARSSVRPRAVYACRKASTRPFANGRLKRTTDCLSRKGAGRFRSYVPTAGIETWRTSSSGTSVPARSCQTGRISSHFSSTWRCRLNTPFHTKNSSSRCMRHGYASRDAVHSPRDDPQTAPLEACCMCPPPLHAKRRATS